MSDIIHTYGDDDDHDYLLESMDREQDLTKREQMNYDAFIKWAMGGPRIEVSGAVLEELDPHGDTSASV